MSDESEEILSEDDALYPVHITILRAECLSVADIASSDPYVVTHLISDDVETARHETCVLRSTLYPDWTLKHPGYTHCVFRPRAASDFLRFDVLDWDRVGHHDFLGHARVPLADIPLHKPSPSVPSSTGIAPLSLLLRRKNGELSSGTLHVRLFRFRPLMPDAILCRVHSAFLSKESPVPSDLSAYERCHDAAQMPEPANHR